MATYLQGVTDAVTQLNPPDSNLQFNMQLLQTRQSKYDQAHAKLSKMYGTILNSGLTREDNIAAREEFFKLVDGDLQKIAGMDLSLDSNVSKAQGVFKQFYTNNQIVKDMVWTKNYQSQQQRAEGFKNCVDDAKCGGQYWEDGEKFMAYKREEFKNMSAQESLYAQDVEYIPYNNLMDQALKDLKEMGGFDMKQDVIDGDYKYTTKNGEILEKPLLGLFNQLYEKNPKFHDMYKVMAYNGRQDWMRSKMSDGTYKNLNEAQVGYIQEYRDSFEKKFNERSQSVTHDKDRLEQLTLGYERDIQAGLVAPDDPKYLETKSLYSNALALDGYNQVYKNAQKNMHSQQSLSNISDYLDNIDAGSLFDEDINKTVNTLKWKGYDQTFALEEKAKMRIEYEYDVALEAVKLSNSIDLETVKSRLRIAEKGLDINTDSFSADQSYSIANEAASNYNPVQVALNEAGVTAISDESSKIIQGQGKYADLTDQQKLAAVLTNEGTGANIELIKLEFEKALGSKTQKQKESNKKALDAIETSVKKGGNPDFDYILFTNPESLTDDDIATLEIYRNSFGKTVPAFDKLYNQYSHRLKTAEAPKLVNGLVDVPTVKSTTSIVSGGVKNFFETN